jgi:hypothetical protein
MDEARKKNTAACELSREVKPIVVLRMHLEDAVPPKGATSGCNIYQTTS